MPRPWHLGFLLVSFLTVTMVFVLFYEDGISRRSSYFDFYQGIEYFDYDQCLVQEVSDDRVEIINLSISQANESLRIEGGNIQEVKEGIEMEKERLYCVPKKLHFIWLGKLIPEKYQQNILSFRKYNPEYEINLWTETISDELRKNLSSITVRDVISEMSDYMTKALIDSEPNVGGKSDILRYEIVYRNGGVYLDTDSISVQPFKDVLTRSFVANIGDPWKNIQNSVFGFPKGSKFLEYVFRALVWNIEEGGEDLGVPWKTGPAFFSGAFVNYNDSNINMIDQKYLVQDKTEFSLSYQTMDATWQ